MTTIYRYAIPAKAFQFKTHFEIEMPKRARILRVALKDQMPCIWALVDTDNDMVTRKFAIRATGADIDIRKLHTYIGSFNMETKQMTFVWHLFEYNDIS